jgi:hypothetical protein
MKFPSKMPGETIYIFDGKGEQGFFNSFFGISNDSIDDSDAMCSTKDLSFALRGTSINVQVFKPVPADDKPVCENLKEVDDHCVSIVVEGEKQLEYVNAVAEKAAIRYFAVDTNNIDVQKEEEMIEFANKHLFNLILADFSNKEEMKLLRNKIRWDIFCHKMITLNEVEE